MTIERSGSLFRPAVPARVTLVLVFFLSLSALFLTGGLPRATAYAPYYSICAKPIAGGQIIVDGSYYYLSWGDGYPDNYVCTTQFIWGVGSQHTIDAPSPAVSNGYDSYDNWVFVSWSDSGAQSHTITAGSTYVYVATYAPPPSTVVPDDKLNAIYMTGYSTGWVIGIGGVIIQGTATNTWNPFSSPTSCDLYGINFGSINGPPPSPYDTNNGWIVGGGGSCGQVALHWNGVSWSLQTNGLSTSSGYLHTVFMVNGGGGYIFVLAGGTDGSTAAIYQYNGVPGWGGGWNRAYTGGSGCVVNGIWGDTAWEAWAVDSCGNILHGFGGGWNQYSYPTGVGMNSIHVWVIGNTLDGWASGNSGNMYHYVYSNWAGPVGPGGFNSLNLQTVSCGSTNTCYAVGNGATSPYEAAFMYSNNYWTWLYTYRMNTCPLNGVFAQSSSNAWFVGDHGTIYRYDGTYFHGIAYAGSTYVCPGPPASITIASSPTTGSGYVTVDSVTQTTPYTASWNAGDSHTIAASSPVSCGSGCQYEYNSWSDGGGQSHSITVPSSATTYTANFKKEWSISFSYSVSGTPPGSPSAPSLSYKRNGVTQSPVTLTGTPTPYWVDDGTTWTISPNPLSPSTSTEQWSTNQATSATASASTTISLTYFHQYKPQLSYGVVGGGAPTAPTLTANSYGSSALPQTLTTTPTVSATWYDAGATWTATNPLGGSSERWYATTSSGTIGASAIAVSYQHQYLLTMAAGTGGTTTAPGAPGTYWENAGTSVMIAALANSGYAFSSWTCTGTGCYSGSLSSTSMTVNAAITETANFVGQVTMTVSYSVVGGGSGYSGPTFNYVYGGVGKVYTLTTTANGVSVDSGSAWSVTPNPLTGSGSSERWYSSGTLSGTASTTTLVFSFYHQYLQTLSYSVSGGSGYSAPSYNANRFGSSAPQTLTITATGYWYDSGSSWSVTNPLSGSMGSEQWSTSQTVSGTVTAVQTIAFSYQHQYYLTMTAGTGGSVTPASGWENSAASVTITATPNSGYGFSSWTGSGNGDYSGGNNPATIIMNGPITETANFVSQVTMTVSYQVIAGGSGYSAPAFNYVQGGVDKVYTLTTTATAVFVDGSSSWSVTPNPLTGTSEQWSSGDPLSGTASTTTLVFHFYHQYSLTLSYMVIAPTGSGYTSPTFTANSYGVSAPQVLTTSAIAYWFDSGSAWSINSPLDGSTGQEQWINSGAGSGTVASSTTIAFTYTHQFYLTMQANPTSEGTESPTSGWQNAGIQIQIDATPAPNYMFTSWAGNGTGGYSGASNPATITMNGPISEVASFQLATVDITITSSSTTGADFATVDGSAISTPQTFSWIIGSSHNITANSPVSCGSGCQYLWQSWSDGGAQSHSYLVPNTPATLQASFKTQFSLTMSVSPVNGGSTTPVAGTYWYDANSTVPISATPASGFEFISWSATSSGYSGSLTSTTITMTGPITETANSQKIASVKMIVSYQVDGGGLGYSPPVFTFVDGGINETYALTTTPSSVAVDQGSSWSVAPNPSTGSTGSERWYATQSLSGTANSNATIIFTFQHQYSVSVSFAVPGGGSAYSAPSFTGTSSAAPISATLSETPYAYWLDAGSAWSAAPNPLSGSTPIERWYSDQALNGTISSAAPIVVTYQHQYLLNMLTDPSGAATTTPPVGSSWQNAGAAITIQATPTTGAFSSWKGSGSGSYTGINDPASITVNDAISETAVIADMTEVTITSSIDPGNAVKVDGTPVSTPYSTTWLVREQHAVSAQSPMGCGSGCQYVWASWSDRGAQTHQVTAQGSNMTLMVNFVKEYSLSISQSTSGSTNPGSGTYWYVVGEVASVSASPSSGYLFTSWLLDGQNAGSSSPLLVTMSASHNIVPQFLSLATPLCVYVNTEPAGLIPAPTMTPSSCPMTPGTQVTVTAQAIPSWDFVEFTATNTTFAQNGITITFTMPPASVSAIAHYKYAGPNAPSLAVPAGDLPSVALIAVIALAALSLRARRLQRARC